MRRIIKFAALAAIPAATLIGTATMASASVSVNDAGTGFVGKGDVQTALGGINDGTLQSMWSDGHVKFTIQVSNAITTKWSCPDGPQSQTSTVIQASPVNVTANANGAGKVANGWNVTGHQVGGAYVSGGRTGAPYVGYCPNGGFGGFLPHEFANDVVVPGSLAVNGMALPNTPIV